MKHLLLFFLFSGSLDSFCQVSTDTTIGLSALPIYVPGSEAITGYVVPAIPPKLDTLPAHILISHKPPSFGHSIEGYCVVKDGVCTGKHLVYRRGKFIALKQQYDVWRCIRKGGGYD